MKQTLQTMNGHHNSANMTTFEEFSKTTYHTAKTIVIPLLNIRLDKSNFIIKGKYSESLLISKLIEIYDLNIEKFK